MINPIHSYTPATQSSSSGKNAESKEQGQMFKNILEEAATNKGDAVQDRKSTHALGEIVSPMNIRIRQPSVVLETRTEDLLSKLELFSSQLEDPGVSLKEVAGLLEEININAQNLLQETKDMEGQGGGDPVLMDIACECAITAQSEYIKFQRGDYI